MYVCDYLTIPDKKYQPKTFFLWSLQKIMGNLVVKLQKIFLQKVFLNFKKLTVTCFMNLLVVFLFGISINWHW